MDIGYSRTDSNLLTQIFKSHPQILLNTFGEEMKKIHFWHFKGNTCIQIQKRFVEKLIKEILAYPDYHYKIALKMGIDESIVNVIRRNSSKKIQINTLKKMVNFLNINGHNISLSDIESHIFWIGPCSGRGITHPKLPFIVKSTDFVKLLSATFNDGTITNISYSNPKKYKLGVFEYTNSNRILIDNIIGSAMEIFGGNNSEYAIRINRNAFSIYFPSVIRDAVLIRGGLQGKKSLYNPRVPSWIYNSSNRMFWIEWLKQSFDDEGSVRFRDNYSHEVYITRVVDITKNFSKKLLPQTKIPFGKLSSKEKNIVMNNTVNLLVDELKLLDKLGINGRLKPQEVYTTKKGEIKTKWRLYITRKENIGNFAKIIGFRDLTKQKILKKILGEKNAT